MRAGPISSRVEAGCDRHNRSAASIVSDGREGAAMRLQPVACRDNCAQEGAPHPASRLRADFPSFGAASPHRSIAPWPEEWIALVQRPASACPSWIALLRSLRYRPGRSAMRVTGKLFHERTTGRTGRRRNRARIRQIATDAGRCGTRCDVAPRAGRVAVTLAAPRGRIETFRSHR